MQSPTLWRCFVACLVMLITIACPSTSTQHEYTTELVFRAKVAHLSHENNPLVHEQAPNDLVEVVVPGRIFIPPQSVPRIPKAARALDTPETASWSDFSANKADDPTWIVDNFALTDQAEIRRYLTDETLRKRHQALFAALTAKQLVGICAYQDYRLLLVCFAGEQPLCTVETYLHENHAWKRTNRLLDDAVFDVIFTAFQHPASRQHIQQRDRVS